MRATRNRDGRQRSVARQLATTLGAALLVVASAVSAQSYPNRPVRIIVPFPAGGPSDVGIRVVGERLASAWNQQVVVENRPGANTIIGAEAVAKAPPDGYTLLSAIDSTLTMNQFLYAKLPYDPIKDFAPVSLLFWSPVILVVDAKSGAATMRDLIAMAKSKPGKVTFGGGTVATQLMGERIKRLANLEIVYVPYKGSPGTVQGLLSNDVDFIIDGVTSSVPHIRSGKFRVLANLGSRPISALPNLPYLSAEPGFENFNAGVWLGLAAPAGTPADVIARINQDVTRALGIAEVKDKLESVGLEAMPSGTAEFAAYIKNEAERSGELIRRVGIKLE